MTWILSRSSLFGNFWRADGFAIASQNEEIPGGPLKNIIIKLHWQPNGWNNVCFNHQANEGFSSQTKMLQQKHCFPFRVIKHCFPFGFIFGIAFFCLDKRLFQIMTSKNFELPKEIKQLWLSVDSLSCRPDLQGHLRSCLPCTRANVKDAVFEDVASPCITRSKFTTRTWGEAHPRDIPKHQPLKEPSQMFGGFKHSIGIWML